MSKKTVGARLPQTLVDRLETIARVDRRSVSQVIEILIERGLSTLEEANETQNLIKEPAQPYKTKSAKH